MNHIQYLAAFSLRCLSTLSFGLGYCCILLSLPLQAADSDSGESQHSMDGFLQQHCFDCHAGEAAEANLDLTQLQVDGQMAQSVGGAGYSTWVKVHDRVRDGEMPPPDYQRLEPETISKFTTQLAGRLQAIQQAVDSQDGRVPARRLTNLQLARTLQDLLGIDIPLLTEIPAEPSNGEFTTLAANQSFSHFQLASYLKVIDLALEEAFRRAESDPDVWTRPMSAKRICRTRKRCREPEFIDGEAVIWSSRLSFYGRLPATRAKQSGWYRVKFRARALKKPQQKGVWCTVRSGKCVSSAPLMSWIGSFEASKEPREFTFEAFLPEGHMIEIRPGDTTLKMARFKGGQAANGEGGKQDVPGIAIDHFEIERFHRGANDSQIREILFGVPDFERQAFVISSAVGQAEDRADAIAAVQARGHRCIERFARRAFRRPLPKADLQPFFHVFDAELDDNGGDGIRALRLAYRAMLCSARFIYLEEQPGELDDYAVATRLSYLLWNSMPDERLLEAAAAGELSSPEALRQQVDRMLAGERGRRFLTDFANEWLELRDIDFTEPDRRLHRDFDLIVQYSMLDETLTFLEHLLRQNRPMKEMIDGDYTFLNSRLARFYGIPNVTGDQLRRVHCDSDSHRGGLLAHGSILKVSANGTNTSPVLRGVWVSKRILGRNIPPPPTGVPAIEPDTRGATTIREQLAKHRDNDQCASCHVKIDPPGFALENFDAAGGWRDHYPVRKGKRVRRGPVIDASYTTADGQEFEGFEAFRKIKAANPRPIARGLAENLIAYGTGAKVRFADRPAIEAIVDQAAEDEFGFRSILYSVVSSDLFRTK